MPAMRKSDRIARLGRGRRHLIMSEEEQMTLGEFAKYLAALLSKNDIALLFKEEAPWHFVLFRLQEETFEGKPEFLNRLRFDWGGPFPKCRELSRYLQFLHLTGCVGTVNPSYERMVLKPELRDLWCTEAEALPRPVQHFMKQALEVAKKEFSNYSVAV